MAPNESLSAERKIKNTFLVPYSLLIGVSALVTLLLWVWAQMVGSTGGNLNYVFALMLAVTPFLASFIGFVAAKEWGGMKSVAGKTIAALSLGLLLWSLGEFIWSYYNLVEKVAAPYPSWADFGYATGVFFWCVSAFILAKLTGVMTLLKSRPVLRFMSLLFIVVSVVVSYYLFVGVARQGQLLSDTHNSLKVILDLAYPLGDIVSLTIIGVVAMVAGGYLGGALKAPILLALGGMFASYLYDLTFSYTTTLGTYYNAQGSDILLLIATVLMSFSLVYYAYNGRKVRSSSLSRRGT